MNKNFLLTRSKVSAGFTLIEIVVVVAIVGIMTTVVVISLENGRIRKELETNASELASVVREAQNYALTGKQAGGGTVCAFSVTWIDSSTYSLGYAPSGNCANVTPLVSHSLKNGVTVSSFGVISFSLPWAEVTGSGQANFSKSSSTYSVCINAEGKVSSQEGAICP